VLDRACASPHHEFWPCEMSLVDEQVIDRTRMHGPRQVTDAYLLALAVSRGGRFVTFQQSVVLSAVSGVTPAHLTVL
jgi:predicted nucleic acid-binding protein